MRVFIIGLLILISLAGTGQIRSGKIVFERRTNLLKKYSDSRMKAWLKDKKIKIDMFEMYFNDTMSIFKPQETDLVEQMDWATMKNTVYQNLKNRGAGSMMYTCLFLTSAIAKPRSFVRSFKNRKIPSTPSKPADWVSPFEAKA